MAKTWAEIQASLPKKPNRQSTIMVFDPEPGQRLTRARIKLAEADARGELDKNSREVKTAIREAKAAVETAEAEQRKVAVEFVFESPGLPSVEALLNAHTPTEKQIAAAEKAPNGVRPDWNKDTFPPALVAACCVQPEGFDDVAAKEMWNDPAWSPGELRDLFETAWLVCDRRQHVWDLDLGKGLSETPS